MIAETITTKALRNVVFALTSTLTGATSSASVAQAQTSSPTGARFHIRKSERSQPGEIPRNLPIRRQPGSAAHQVVARGLRAGVAA